MKKGLLKLKEHKQSERTVISVFERLVPSKWCPL